MRIINSNDIVDIVARLCIEANTQLPTDIADALYNAKMNEPWDLARSTLSLLEDNLCLAKQKNLPICQDTGMACVFLEIGNEVFIEGDIYAAVNEGVRRGYTEGYLRKSITADPILRKNTEDNTPAFITTEFTSSNKLRITVAPKGAGSENMSRLAMLNPADGIDGVKNFVIEAVKAAGSNPCPPIIVGLGIGGTFDKVAYLAKKALLRPLNIPNADRFYAEFENELMAEVNALGIGPQGFGGKTTCLGVSIEKAATHVASLPVAVNISCHVTRRASAEL